MSAVTESGLFLDGLRCAGCAQRVERTLRELPGVRDARVDFTSHRARVHHDEALATEALVSQVEALGYSAVAYDPSALDRPARRGAREALSRLLVAGFLAGNVMVAAGALYLGEIEGMEPEVRRGLRWLCFGLSLPAATWCALPFWRGAWQGLRQRSITMDVPIVLGVSAALVGNAVGTWSESPRVFADSAAMIVFLILLGRTLERGARARAAGAVERLLALAPRTARRVRDGRTEEVPVAELVRGDLVVVAPGGTIPVDARIVSGESELDASLLTGESRPVACAPGARVVGGAHNLMGELTLEVLAASDAGTLAAMAALLERASAERPSMQRAADRVAAFFAPAVLLVAGLAAVGWTLAGAAPLDVLLLVAAILIVACPCALGLAAPVAIAAAIGRAARFGVIVKSGDALERCARVDRALLDKTGTVTEGVLRVDRVLTAPGIDAAHVIALADAAEGSSSHPVAAAIRRAAEDEAAGVPGEVGLRRALPGRGVEAKLDGEPLLVGARSFLDERGVAIPAALDAEADAMAARGLSLAWVARGGAACGVLCLSDPPREDAREAVTRLAAAGITTGLVSGDHPAAARLAGERAGIDEIASEVTPEGKVACVREAHEAGENVVFVGDGINDAAALAAADVGIAMAHGTDIAVSAADLVVCGARLGAVADVVALARTTMRRIRENLGLALLYNAAAIPLAVAGWIDPLTAAAAMGLSSLVVTGNAVRLLRWRPAS